MILTALDKWKRCDLWKKDDGQYIMHTRRWLHGRCWEVTPTITKSKVQQEKQAIEANRQQRLKKWAEQLRIPPRKMELTKKFKELRQAKRGK